jgi:carbamoyl-phosphate synthase large subunit
MIQRLQLRQPNNSIVKSAEEGISEAAKVGYPLVVRPSYVLGGRAMEIVYNEEELKRYFVKQFKHLMKHLFCLTIS